MGAVVVSIAELEPGQELLATAQVSGTGTAGATVVLARVAAGTSARKLTEAAETDKRPTVELVQESRRLQAETRDVSNMDSYGRLREC